MSGPSQPRAFNALSSLSPGSPFCRLMKSTSAPLSGARRSRAMLRRALVQRRPGSSRKPPDHTSPTRDRVLGPSRASHRATSAGSAARYGVSPGIVPSVVPKAKGRLINSAWQSAGGGETVCSITSSTPSSPFKRRTRGAGTSSTTRAPRALTFLA